MENNVPEVVTDSSNYGVPDDLSVVHGGKQHPEVEVVARGNSCTEDTDLFEPAGVEPGRMEEERLALQVKTARVEADGALLEVARPGEGLVAKSSQDRTKSNEITHAMMEYVPEVVVAPGCILSSNGNVAVAEPLLAGEATTDLEPTGRINMEVCDRDLSVICDHARSSIFPMLSDDCCLQCFSDSRTCRLGKT